MRCRVGDLAYVSSAKRDPSRYGQVVLVVELYDPVSWVVKPPVITSDGVEYASVMDYALTPIRDQSGEDETLTWKDVPSEVTA